MKILAADTALGACSVAVLDGDEARAHRFVLMERGHAETLAPMAERAMADAQLAFPALDRLAVTVGPGTFTGQRVGLAFMRGLRIALKKPLAGVTTLEAMAAQAMAETGLALAAALHDARRGEVYFAVHDAAGERAAAQIAPLGEAVALVAAIAGDRPLALAGTAAPAALQGLRNARLCAVRQPDALWVARLASRAPAADIAPKPLYLRPSDARLPEKQP